MWVKSYGAILVVISRERIFEKWERSARFFFNGTIARLLVHEVILRLNDVKIIRCPILNYTQHVTRTEEKSCLIASSYPRIS